jgi:hypothetical protein
MYLDVHQEWNAEGDKHKDYIASVYRKLYIFMCLFFLKN